MKIGFTYDLKSDYLAMGFNLQQAAEFDAPETIDGISEALTSLGYQVDRIGNVHSLLKRLARGERWDLVFNICEGVKGIGREAQVPAILDVYDIPYVFSDVQVLSLTLNKAMTKRVIRDMGIPTAPFFTVENIDDLQKSSLPFPLFAKPVAEGTGKGINAFSKIENNDQLYRVCSQLLEEFKQPVLVERYLPGREVTVGITGNGPEAKVIGIIEVIFNKNENTGIYSFENKANYEQFIRYRSIEDDLFESCSKVALDSWRGLGCRDGGRVDLRLDDKGIPNFIEVNPLAGLNPVHSDLPILASMAGISFNSLIKMIMDACLKRLPDLVEKNTEIPALAAVNGAPETVL